MQLKQEGNLLKMHNENNKPKLFYIKTKSIAMDLINLGFPLLNKVLLRDEDTFNHFTKYYVFEHTDEFYETLKDLSMKRSFQFDIDELNLLISHMNMISNFSDDENDKLTANKISNKLLFN